MNREDMLTRSRGRETPYDIIIIGGGATGAGCAVDASSRGFDVLLVEQHDFGKGTSSRSTKLVHGGVRYLEQGNISLVREALKERGILKKNAPHVVKNQTFIIPCYSVWQKIYYGIGLKVYDLLSGRYSLERSRILSRKQTIENIPAVIKDNLAGGVAYCDGQFDDSRLLIDLIKTAAKRGATVLNYAKVVSLSKNTDNKIDGVSFACGETGEEFEVKGKVVINATGAFTDHIRNLSKSGSAAIVTHSQGIHLVFDSSFLPTTNAIMIPKTSDGRVLFAIPWNGKTMVGTTDTPIESAQLEPAPFESEIEFILETCRQYLSVPPTRSDILSVFVGIRPLVKSSHKKNTASLSRDHTIEVDEADLLTITGGKWTTYRHMAEDAINNAIKIAALRESACVTESLAIEETSQSEINEITGNNALLGERLDKDLAYLKADVVNAVRNEMARTVEDVLARRTRILFLDAKTAVRISPVVAEMMASEMGKDREWIEDQITAFAILAETYLV